MCARRGAWTYESTMGKCQTREQIWMGLRGQSQMVKSLTHSCSVRRWLADLKLGEKNTAKTWTGKTWTGKTCSLMAQASCSSRGAMERRRWCKEFCWLHRQVDC